MKKTNLALLVLALFLANFLSGQEKQTQEMRTLFGHNDNISHGGYGALQINYSQFDGKDAVLVGGKGGWIIDHGIVLGLGGYGFANQISFDDLGPIGSSDEDIFLSGGYGGFLVEAIIMPMRPVHVSIPLLIGGGGAAYVNNGWYDEYHEDWEYYVIDSSPFFVLEPGIEIEFNVVKFMRIGLGGYYRYTSGLDLENSKEHLLDGFSAGLSLKFGKF